MAVFPDASLSSFDEDMEWVEPRQVCAGDRIGERYRLGEVIGTGGMGVVFRAHDERLRRDVAIKVLAPERRSPEWVARFAREMAALARVSHPNVVTLYDSDEHDGQIYAVMELLSGESLAQRLKRGPFPVHEALGIARQLASALIAAHDAGVVHRDVKPANVFVETGGRVRLLDFGLARTGDTTEDGTRPGTIMGTNGYMSPEQALGDPVDHRSDLFSLGCVLYEMLSGRRAFPGTRMPDVVRAIVHADPLPLAIDPGGLDRIVERCLAKPLEDRFQSARDLEFALALFDQDPEGPTLRHQRPTVAAGPQSDEGSAPRSLRRAWLARIGAAIGHFAS